LRRNQVSLDVLPLYVIDNPFTAIFSCPLVASLPYCPTVSYAVPLPAPPLPSTIYDSTNLPSKLTSDLLEYMTNFTTTLLTFACGRDLYSPLSSCADCQAAYRTWLCTIQFIRCSEAPPAGVTSPPDTNASDIEGRPQAPFSALASQPPSATPRNPDFPTLGTGYTVLLPCLETCTAVDRACPNFLQFRCPVPRFNAGVSYGVGYIDSGREGEQGGGMVGQVVDRWGNIWCNGG
jgi:calcium channel MID1